MNGDHSLYGRADGDTACGDDPQRLYALDPGLAEGADDRVTRSTLSNTIKVAVDASASLS